MKIYRCTYSKCPHYIGHKCLITEKQLDRRFELNQPICLAGENVEIKDLREEKDYE